MHVKLVATVVSHCRSCIQVSAFD